MWLLSAYRADSHAAWSDWLVSRFEHIQWQRLELPGRHFRWRIRGNPLSWLAQLPADQPDRMIATSMVDLATLKGLHPRLAQVPVDYYFHENQFAYPPGEHQVRSVEPQMVQLYGALAAERLIFNSAFNRDSFIDGVDHLIRRMPDERPRHVGARLARKSVVCPVPVKPVTQGVERDPRLIVWNHRWEYDKAPEVFAAAVRQLAADGVDFRLALLGPRPRRTPPSLAVLRRELAARIVADGKVERARYEQLLGTAGIVVSTALHEFQGLAVLEAASAGARPLVPDALCYPEQYAAAYRYPPGDGAALRARLAQWLEVALPPPVDVSAWYEQALEPAWRQLLPGAGARARVRPMS